jgi:LemA protein
MSALSITLIVVVIVLIFAVLAVVGIYNRLVVLRNRFKNAFAQIDVQLTRRHDLIPNLVETVKGYMAHEKETLQAVIQARSSAVNAQSQAASNPANAQAMSKLSQAEGMLSGALGRLMMVVEQYPELKANDSVMQLNEELTTTENKIAFARQGYNDSVMIYNTARERFPNNVFASMFQFQEAALFTIENEETKKAPKVSFAS